MIPRKEIIESAKQYEAHEFRLFLAEEGWQDWMNDYTTAPEDQEITEAEGNIIEIIQKKLFIEAQEEKAEQIQRELDEDHAE